MAGAVVRSIPSQFASRSTERAPSLADSKHVIIAAYGSLCVAIVALAFAGLQWLDTRQYNTLLLKPSVDFYTEDDPTEPIVGIEIMNSGPGPATIAEMTYYVDRKPVRDEEEAEAYGKLNADLVRYFAFDENDTLAVNERHWLFYRSTKNKKELDRFVDFVDQHVAIKVKFCSMKNECETKCSTKDRC